MQDYRLVYKSSNEVPTNALRNGYFGLFLSCEGNARVIINQKTFSVTSPSLILLRPTDKFNFLISSDMPFTRYELTFLPYWVNQFEDYGIDLMECFLYRPDTVSMVLPLDSQEEVDLVEEFKKLHSKHEHEFPHYGYRLEIRLAIILILLKANKLFRKANRLIDDDLPLVNQSISQQIIDYIHKNYWDDINIEGLSLRFDIHRKDLYKSFYELTGTSPINYLINFRLLKAQEFLIIGNTVEEACGKVGFNNFPHFSKIFKDRIGVGPKQFQQSVKERT